jgi:DNA-binding transcriptional ArsR family regulator
MNHRESAKLSKALGHPLRFAIISALREHGELSPVELSRERGEALGTIAYHFGALAKAGVIEISGRVPRRGALEHRYSLTGPKALAAIGVLDLLASA